MSDRIDGTRTPEIDWRALAARHHEAPHEDDAAWLEALGAFDEDPESHPEALEADPLLLFRQMAEPTVDDAEIESMREAVAGLRRASDVLGREASGASRTTRRVVTSWRTAAALAAALVGALLVSPAADWSPSGEDVRSQVASEVVQPEAAQSAASLTETDETMAAPTELAATTSAAPETASPSASGFALASLDSLPLVEEADARPWIQIEDDSLSLVIVDLDAPVRFDGGLDAGDFDA